VCFIPTQSGLGLAVKTTENGTQQEKIHRTDKSPTKYKHKKETDEM